MAGMVGSSRLMLIFIKSLNDKTITLVVEPSYTINKVMAEITRLEGIRSGEQRLVRHGYAIGVGGLCTLLEAGITPGTTLVMAPEEGVAVIEVSTGRKGFCFASSDRENYLILWQSDVAQWDGPDEAHDWRKAAELRFC